MQNYQKKNTWYLTYPLTNNDTYNHVLQPDFDAILSVETTSKKERRFSSWTQSPGFPRPDGPDTKGTEKESLEGRNRAW